MLKKSEVLKEGYIKGLREAADAINEILLEDAENELDDKIPTKEEWDRVYYFLCDSERERYIQVGGYGEICNFFLKCLKSPDSHNIEIQYITTENSRIAFCKLDDYKFLLDYPISSQNRYIYLHVPIDTAKKLLSKELKPEFLTFKSYFLKEFQKELSINPSLSNRLIGLYYLGQLTAECLYEEEDYTTLVPRFLSIFEPFMEKGIGIAKEVENAEIFKEILYENGIKFNTTDFYTAQTPELCSKALCGMDLHDLIVKMTDKIMGRTRKECLPVVEKN